MSRMLTGEEVMLHWGRLTEQQQEDFTEASVAYRKALCLASDLIHDALDIEEQA